LELEEVLFLKAVTKYQLTDQRSNEDMRGELQKVNMNLRTNDYEKNSLQYLGRAISIRSCGGP
jgi:hypothetical protein